ncbi:MAG: recombinase family protein, partial [Desulfobacterales bacterium]|nr:recombinase family protein [Desulfobacterales bacterium]
SSIESQIDICKHYIEIQREKGWEFVGSYTDPGYSGKNLERPGIQQALSDVRAGKIDVFMVYKLERLARSIRDFYDVWDILKENKVTFVSATQQFDTSTATGMLMLNILLSFAQYERENVSEKTRDKMKQRAKLGMWHGGWMPYGYDYDKESQRLLVNKEESAAVKKIYKRFLEGQKPSEIANTLNDAGLRTKSRDVVRKDGKKVVVGANRFNEDMIKKVLSNPIYKGFVHLGGEEYKGKHQALVDEKDWKTAQNKLYSKKPRQEAYQKDDHVHLLKGILKCGECDAAITPYPSGKKDKSGKPYLYYACGKVVDFGKHSPCKVRMLPAREFEGVIKEACSELGKNKSLIESAIKNTAKHNTQALKPLETEKEQLVHKTIKATAEINRLIKIMKDKDNVGKEISDEYKKLLTEKTATETRKEKLEIDIERCKQDTLDAESVAKTLQEFQKVISVLPLDDQKDLFQLLFREIRVWGFDPQKEKAPHLPHGAFLTKIRTKWYKIKLDLYQFPEIEAYYKSISKKLASSDITKKWLPREDSDLGPGGYRFPGITSGRGLYLCRRLNVSAAGA